MKNINYLVDKHLKDVEESLRRYKEETNNLVNNFEEYNRLVLSRLQENAYDNREIIKQNNSLDYETLIKRYQSIIKSIDNFLIFYSKVTEIVETQKHLNNSQHEYKAIVLEMKVYYQFYKRFFCEAFKELDSYPALIIQFSDKTLSGSVEMFESFIEMTQNSFILIPNFINEGYQFLNYGIEKAFFSLGYYLEVVFTHHPNIPLKLMSFHELSEIKKGLNSFSRSFTLIVLSKNTSNDLVSETLTNQEIEDETNFKMKYSIIKDISKKYKLRYIIFFSDFLYDKNNGLILSPTVTSIRENQEEIERTWDIAPDYMLEEVASVYKIDLDLKQTLDFFKESEKIDKEIEVNKEKLEEIENENIEIIERLLKL